MSFLDGLRALRNKPQAVWLRFVVAYRVACFDLYLFFEGKDDFSFYQPYLRQVWSDRGVLHGFNCEGKKEVIQIMPKVKSKLDYEWRGLFFTDKDVDDYCGHTPHKDQFLYQTESYAIESFIVSEKTLHVIWTDLLSLPLEDPRLAHVLSAFKLAYESFAVVMKSVMAWIIHLRRAGHRVFLNNVNMKKLIDLDGDCKCTLAGGWAEHILAASSTPGVYDSVAHNAVIAELNPCDPKTYIRGKFDLWFFVSFVNKVIATLSERGAGAPRSTCSVQISEATAIDVLAPRLEPPATLAAFIDQALPK